MRYTLSATSELVAQKETIVEESRFGSSYFASQGHNCDL